MGMITTEPAAMAAVVLRKRAERAYLEERWVGGWVWGGVSWVVEIEAVRKSYCEGEWAGWVGGWIDVPHGHGGVGAEDEGQAESEVRGEGRAEAHHSIHDRTKNQGEHDL